MRERLFEELSTYKEVVSPGSFMNNTGSGEKRCSWKEKYEFQRLSKLTISCDSIRFPGFVTEKIVDPFIAHSIPIYCGNPRINEDFNEKAFVWCKDESRIEDTLKRIEYLDNNYMNPISLDSLAENIQISKEYACALFKKEMKQTISHHLTDLRLSHAAIFLTQYPQKKVSEIGNMCGFDNSSYFCMVFKKMYGVTPAQYRSNTNI